MAWFRKRRKEQKALTEDQIRQLFGVVDSKSGVNVTWKTALEASTAMACAVVIAQDIGKIPLKLFRKTEGGGKEDATDHALYERLNLMPNEWQTSSEFFEQMGLHLVFCGNFFAFKNVVRGSVTELLPFEPGAVTVKRSDSGVLSYDVRLKSGETQTISSDNMWHVRGPSWNGWMGLEGVKLAREAIGLSLATEEHSARLFSNGARISGVLTTDSQLKEDQVKLLRESWQNTYAGGENAHKTAILWGGLKWSPLALQSDHAQMIETRKFQVEEICRMFRVHPIMVGYSDKTATYASTEQMFMAHIRNTMQPWYRKIEQSIDVNLLSPEDRRNGLYAKFIVGAFLHGTMKDQADYLSKALGAGGSPAWMTQDEARAMIELNPMGGSAAVLPVSNNVGSSDANP
jgi:HK97 family phage portal protein